jgi:hypothetical protein
VVQIHLYFATGVQRGASVGGNAHCSKKKLALFKKQEKVVSAPMMESIYQARKVACFVLFCSY